MNLLVCPEVRAAKVGRDVFAAGGNAMDAAVAAAFAQGVTNHLLCGIGGTLSIYHFNGTTGEEAIFNAEQVMGSVPVPPSWAEEVKPDRDDASWRFLLDSSANTIGPQAVMVPGFVRGCWVAFQRAGSGRLRWADLLEPAIRIAEDGFEVSSYLAHWFRQVVLEDRERCREGGTPRWEVSRDSAKLFLRDDGEPYEQGDWFVQRELAHTLRRIATGGGDEFYSGDLGREIAARLGAQGGLVTADDLAGYQVLEDQPLSGTYRGSALAAQPRSNGAQLIVTLQILDRLDLRSLGHNSAAYIDLVAKAFRIGCAESLRAEGREPAEWSEIEADIVSSERADVWAERIMKNDPIDLPAGVPARGTTALTAVDEAGSWVSLNHSVGVGGSGVVIDGLGFLLNGDVAHFNPVPGHHDSAEPGKRFFGGSPLVLRRDERPWLAVSAPGGTRIATSMVQTVLNVVEFDMDPRTAVTAPRIHSQDGRRIYLEPMMPADLEAELGILGADVLRSRYQARPQVIVNDDGRIEGGSDPRDQTSSDVGRYPQPDFDEVPYQNT
jgi:gamma-glutamyltranspeptidase / glutathione hydrolase